MEKAKGKCDRIVLEALYNYVETILEDRVSLSPQDAHKKYKPPFNLDHLMNDAVRQDMDPWKHNVYSPLVLDVFHLVPGSHGGAPQQQLIERWQAVFVRETPVGGVRDVTGQLKAAYRHFSIFFRTLFCMLRVLPATKIARACRRSRRQNGDVMGPSGKVQYAIYADPSSLAQEIYGLGQMHSHYAAASNSSVNLKWDCKNHRFTEIRTPFGTLHLTVQYRRSVSSQIPINGRNASVANATEASPPMPAAVPRQPRNTGSRHEYAQRRPRQNSAMAPQSMPDRLGYMHARPGGANYAQARRSGGMHSGSHARGSASHSSQGGTGPRSYGSWEDQHSVHSGSGSNMSSGHPQRGNQGWNRQQFDSGAPRRHSDAPRPTRGGAGSLGSSPASDGYVAPSRPRSRTVSESYDQHGSYVSQGSYGTPPNQWTGSQASRHRQHPSSGSVNDGDPLSGFSSEGVGIPRSISSDKLKYLNNENAATYGSLPSQFPPQRHVSHYPTYGHGGHMPGYQYQRRGYSPGPYGTASRGDVPGPSRQWSGSSVRKDSFDSALSFISPQSYQSSYMTDDASEDSSGGARRHSSGMDASGRHSAHRGSYDTSAPIHIHRDTPPRHPHQSGSFGSGSANSRGRNSYDRNYRSGGTPPPETLGFSGTSSHGSSHGSSGGMAVPTGSFDNGSYDRRRHSSGWSETGSGSSHSNPFGKSPRNPSPLTGSLTPSPGSSVDGGANESIFGISRAEPQRNEPNEMGASFVSTLRPNASLPTVPDDDESQLGHSTSMGGPMSELYEDDDEDDRSTSPIFPFAFDEDTGSPEPEDPDVDSGFPQNFGSMTPSRNKFSDANALLQRCNALEKNPPLPYSDVFGSDSRAFSLEALRDLARQVN